ncbi:MAG: tyrosine-type recombinase/integrase, partial [Erysipelotrichales bacterium]|nr:tyrosine-type recombinase/integrase [Erysipelotrichales bacterium]
MTYKRRVKKIGGQKETWPIKDTKLLDSFLLYWSIRRDKAKSEVKRFQADRNWMLCMMGVNTAHRAEDLLQLRVADIEAGYVTIRENKTGKAQNYRMNKELHNQILEYVDRNELTRGMYLFPGQKNMNFAITRQRSH